MECKPVLRPAFERLQSPYSCPVDNSFVCSCECCPFPTGCVFSFFFQLPWSLGVKSLEARINETSSHGLNEVLSEVGNQNACWWVCLDILCLSSGQCVFSYVIVLQLQ